MYGFIERSLLERRSLEQTLDDLVAKNRALPPGNQSAELARMIQDLETEIARRVRPKGRQPKKSYAFVAPASQPDQPLA
jgi:hypothetical protein